MKSKYPALLLLILAFSCNPGTAIDPELLQTEFATPEGGKQTVRVLSGKQATAIVFYSPECPLCVNYSKTLNDIHDRYKEKGIALVIVYPSTYYTAESIRTFHSQYLMELPALLDPQLLLANTCRATVTPEAALVDASGEIVYRGAVDDWAYATGKKRPKALHHYLINAIDSLLAGNKPDPSFTESIGCFIE